MPIARARSNRFPVLGAGDPALLLAAPTGGSLPRFPTSMRDGVLPSPSRFHWA